MYVWSRVLYMYVCSALYLCLYTNTRTIFVEREAQYDKNIFCFILQSFPNGPFP